MVSLLSVQSSLAAEPDGAPATTTTTATASTTAPASTTTTTPPVSGEAAPSTPPNGYHTTFVDSFASSTLSSIWVPFDGTPSGDPEGQWSPSHLVVGNGELQIQGYADPAYGGKWTSGGVLLLPQLGQTYGDYQMRMRIDPGHGTGFDLLLWPTSGGGSNGYIDFGSDNSGTGDGSRQVLYGSLHAASGAVTTSTTAVDLTSWHTIGVIWSPGQVSFTLDGQVWQTITSSSVPSVPLAPQIKMQGVACATISCPTTPDVNMDLNWVAVFAPGAPALDGAPATTTTTATASTTAPASTTTTTPPVSGEAMPTTAPAGWQEIFSDDFPGATLDPSKWTMYNGVAAGDPGAYFSSSHVSVENGELVLQGYKDPNFGDRWVTAGVSSSPGLTQAYGKYLVRFRVDAGTGISYTALLWPADNAGSPEIDFAEDNGGDRQVVYSTLHTASGQKIVQTSVVDMTQWHTLGVEWAPSGITYTLDGYIMNTVPASSLPSGSSIPDIPMALDLQTQAWACGSTETWETCPGSSTPPEVDMDIAWVVAYAMD